MKLAPTPDGVVKVDAPPKESAALRFFFALISFSKASVSNFELVASEPPKKEGSDAVAPNVGILLVGRVPNPAKVVSSLALANKSDLDTSILGKSDLASFVSLG